MMATASLVETPIIPTGAHTRTVDMIMTSHGRPKQALGHAVGVPSPVGLRTLEPLTTRVSTNARRIPTARETTVGVAIGDAQVADLECRVPAAAERLGQLRHALARSFGARAASSSTVSFTYRQHVVVETPNPAPISANGSPLRRCTSTSMACCPGLSTRHGVPISRRWARTSPDTKVRV